MDINSSTIECALLEIEQIKSRRDGVHSLHNIYFSIRNYDYLFKKNGVGAEEIAMIREFLPVLMRRARIIDKIGFDPITPDCRRISLAQKFVQFGD
jgi:hypothetical protein